MVVTIKKSNILNLICAVLAFGFLLLAPLAQAEPFKREASGWFNDADAEIEGFGTITTFGKGTFGQSVANFMGQAGPWSGEFCRFDPANGIISVELPMLISSAVFRFANGDLLFAALAPLPPSRLCVDILTQKISARIHMDVTGGTGKFRDAAGSLLVRRVGRRLVQQGDIVVHASVLETVEGEIFLEHNDD